MKTVTAQFIDERVVRHIARKYYGMTFCEEYAMHQRNQRENTSWPAMLAVVMTLVCAIGPFMLKGQDQVIASVFGIIFGVAFLYGAIMLCTQEYRLNRQWQDICENLRNFI